MISKLFGPVVVFLVISCFSFSETDTEKADSTLLRRDHEVHQFRAHNGIRFEYGLLLPNGYDKNRSYEIIAVLCEVHRKDQSWESTMNQFASIELDRSILVIPKVPIGEEHWGTHPIHHGFNDLLKSVGNSYGKSRQKFHLIGFESGQETAFWWTHGSSDLIASTSVINGKLWAEERWDQKWYKNLSRSNVPIYAYEYDAIDKFAMPDFEFRPMVGINQVIDDIEERNRP